MAKKWFLMLAAILSLCACSNNGKNSSTSVKTKNYDFDSYKDLQATYTFASDSPISYRQVKKSEGWQAMRSVGEARILVIPVDFPDARCDILPGGCEQVRSDLEKTYFGTSEDTKLPGQDPNGWESLSSFYRKSSFNKLNITGVVAPWQTSTYRVADLSSTASSPAIVRDAVNAYKEYCVENELPFDFDADQDGYIDCVQVIYSVRSQFAGKDIWWAYTSMIRGARADFTSPTPKQYVFASYDFMYSDTHYLDAHTYIHETGHVLGLEDYYNTSDNPRLKVRRPTGGLAMMDMNIGDHDGYSKFALNWTEPKVVTSEGSISIRPAVTTGDSIIVSPDWKGTAFDEYLLIEYSRPIGLNETDATRPYSSSGYPLIFSENGVKVYHIDSRLAYVDYPGFGFVDYTDRIIEDATHVTMLAHSNTPNNDESPSLIHLLESSGKNLLYQGKYATNDDLFKEGDTFGAEKGKFDTFKFNSGLDLPYVFKITSMTDDEVVITFVKK